MISLTGTDFQTHELRNVSVGFKEALRIWQRECPTDKMFCTLHGKMEEISLYVPESIAWKRDKVEEDQAICASYEQSERERVDRDIAAGRTRSVRGR